MDEIYISTGKELLDLDFESCPYYHDHGYCIGCMYYGYGDEPWSGDDCPFGKEE